MFPPAVVGAVALELSEAALVAGVAVEVAVAIEHPTQDNWVMVGGDALAIATGYVVGKVIIGPALRGVQGLLRREVGAEASAALPQTQQAAQQAIADAQQAAAAKAAAEKLAAEKAAERLAPRSAALGPGGRLGAGPPHSCSVTGTLPCCPAAGGPRWPLPARVAAAGGRG